MPVARIAARVFAVASILALAACATPAPSKTAGPVDIGGTLKVTYGQIVSMRPVMAPARTNGAAGLPAGSDIGGSILGAVGASAAATSMSQAPAFEFIIREDNVAQPISVVQSDAADFHPGERVVLTRGLHTLIARAAGA